MEIVSSLPNHEIWKECTICGAIYDEKLHGNRCPVCHYAMRRLRYALIYPVFILLFLLLMSSCVNLKYAVRQHNCKLIEQEAQLHGKLKLDSRAKQNFYWSMRPTGKWPFQFLH